MANKTKIILFCLLGLACLEPYGCNRKPGILKALSGDAYNFILISVDTLRADRLGCYGFKNIETPAIDGMARRGIKFELCIAQTPLTLPSHTTLLTGTYPAFHGVRDNGGFLVPQQLKTLAELFKEEGYATGAVVGAYVLDSKWGLNQGFDFYFDRFDISRKTGFSIADVQRPAGEAVSQALVWLKEQKSHPFFLFLHLYDPHTPYEPPSPFRGQYAQDLYLGEIAYTDSELKWLWATLGEEGLLERTIIVFCSDHGESLGEHGEATHGFFAYQEAIHVPLIFVLPFAPFQNRSVPDTVSLVDVAPTLLELAGIPVPPEVQGKSLLPFIDGSHSSGDGYAYAETFYPRFHYGWSEVKTIQNHRYKLILSPGRELYDLTADPEEEHDLAPQESRTALELERALGRFEEQAARGRLRENYQKVDAETLRKLASLGYLGTFGSEANDQTRVLLPSPRAKIGVFNRISEAKELSLRGDLVAAGRIMAEVIGEDPEIVDAYFIMGNICFKQKEYREAVAWLSRALERKPDYDFVVLNMAIAYVELDDPAKAEEVLTNFINSFPADPILYLTLGQIHLSREDYPQAIRSFEECLRLNSRSADAHNFLSRVYIILGDADKSSFHLARARELNSQLRNIAYNSAQIHEMMGESAEAERDYLTEIEHYPDNDNACFNLALLLIQRKDEDRAEEYLRKTVAINPEFSLGYLYLGKLQSERNTDIDQANLFLQKAVSLGLDARHLKLAYYLLAKNYLQAGDQARASRYARMIEELDKKSK